MQPMSPDQFAYYCMANVMRLRNGLAAHAFIVLGQPSAIVPVALGTLAEGRVMTKVALAAGALVNNFEHQAIGGKSACWPLLVMADHTAEHIDKMIAVALLARARVVQAG